MEHKIEKKKSGRAVEITANVYMILGGIFAVATFLAFILYPEGENKGGTLAIEMSDAIGVFFWSALLTQIFIPIGIILLLSAFFVKASRLTLIKIVVTTLLVSWPWLYVILT